MAAAFGKFGAFMQQSEHEKTKHGNEYWIHVSVTQHKYGYNICVHMALSPPSSLFFLKLVHLLYQYHQLIYIEE